MKCVEVQRFLVAIVHGMDDLQCDELLISLVASLLIGMIETGFGKIRMPYATVMLGVPAGVSVAHRSVALESFYLLFLFR